jgi:hypothetical protein
MSDQEHLPTDLAAVEGVRAQLRAMSEVERARFEEDFKWLVGHKPGRRIVWWLLSQAGVFRNPWRPSANEMSFVVGNMNLGQAVLAEMLTIAPDSFTTMMREANDDGKRRG